MDINKETMLKKIIQNTFDDVEIKNILYSQELSGILYIKLSNVNIECRNHEISINSNSKKANSFKKTYSYNSMNEALQLINQYKEKEND